MEEDGAYAETAISGGITGFIRPPPVPRELIDKTAAFIVAKGGGIGGGGTLEAALLSRADASRAAKLAFLKPDHPYHAYYRHRLAELVAAREAEAAPAALPTGVAGAAGGPSAGAPATDADASGLTPIVAASAPAPTAPAPSSGTVRKAAMANPIARALKALQLDAGSAPASTGAPSASAAQAGGQTLASTGQGAPTDGASEGGAGATAGASVDLVKTAPAYQFYSFAVANVHDALVQGTSEDGSSMSSATAYLTALCSPAQRDLIKLTAQFTAAQGKSFLNRLTEEEAAAASASASSGGGVPSVRGGMYDFLRPTHPLFAYFTALVESYARILHPDKLMPGIVQAATSRDAVLRKAVHRMEARRIEATRRMDAAAAQEHERAAVAAIPWHEFVVVETIGWDDEDDMDAGSSTDAATAAHAAQTKVERAAPRAATAAVPSAPPAASSGGGMQNGGGVEEEEPLHVVHDYKPGTAALTAPATSASTTFLDTRTGRLIPAEQASEQLRVELIDPQWAKQQATYLARKATSLYVAGDELASNLKRLAAKREDVFGEGSTDKLSASGATSAVGPSLPSAKRPRIEDGASLGAPPPPPRAVAPVQMQQDDDDAPPGT